MRVLNRKLSTKHLIVMMSIAIAVALLLGGIYSPDGFMMSFASSGDIHTALRAFVIVGLLAILVSQPPRSMTFRIVLALVSSALLIGSVASIIEYRIGILDIVLYSQVAIILAIEAIERQTAPVRFALTAAK